MSHTSRSPPVEILAGAHNFNVEHQYISVSSPSSPPLSTHEIHHLLSPIPGASHTRNMKRSPPDSTCLPGTRTMLLSSIMTWVKSDTSQQAGGSTIAQSGWRDDYGYYHYHPPNAKRVVWLCGPVGCGKSAIAQMVAKEADHEEEGCLAASFFFFRGMGDRSGIARVAATLASQMAEAIPETLPCVMDALKKPLSLQDASIETQFERLIYHPILAALGGRKRRPVLILIDGLDECEDRLEVEEFIDHMLSMFERHPDLPLRFFISSRIEEHIREHIEVNQVHVVNLRDHHSDKDISTVVQHTFKVAATRNRVIRSYGNWPSEEEIRALIQQARGSFIFIRTLLNFILGVESERSDRRTPMERFKLALTMDRGLDGLYTEILQDTLLTAHSTNVILTLATLMEPLSISVMARLLGIRACDVANVLIPLQSIVHVPGDDETRVTLFHTSLREFIRNVDRSHVLFSETSRGDHRRFLAQRCLRLRMQTQEDDQSTFPYSMHYWATHWADAYSGATDLYALMDSVDAAAGEMVSPIPLRLAIILFNAQIRTSRYGDSPPLFSLDTLCDWLSDSFRRPLPALHIARTVVYGVVGTSTACDPSLHRCTVMHAMRSFVSRDSKRTCFQYIAQNMSWNILRAVDTGDAVGDSDHDIATFLRTPYFPSAGDTDSSASQLGADRPSPLSTLSFDSTTTQFLWDDERLLSIADILQRKFPGMLDSSHERVAEEIWGYSIIYTEDGFSVLDMIHLLHLLDKAQDESGTHHVMVHIADGNIICFSNHFTEERLVVGFKILRFNLYTDDIFELFSRHSQWRDF